LAENDFRASFIGQLPMPTDKVGVQMCFDNVLDPEILRFGFFDVLVNVALRIDNRGFAC
jgi:hypothetical protein